MDALTPLAKLAGQGGVTTIMALILLAGVYMIVNRFMTSLAELNKQNGDMWARLLEQMDDVTEALNNLTHSQALMEERLKGEVKALRRELEVMQRTGAGRREDL